MIQIIIIILHLKLTLKKDWGNTDSGVVAAYVLHKGLLVGPGYITIYTILKIGSNAHLKLLKLIDGTELNHFFTAPHPPNPA